MSDFRARVALFEHLLDPKSHAVLDFERIRRLCYHGIPESGNIRQLSWKLLLNFIPSDTSSWKSIVAAKRFIYHGFVRDFCDVRPTVEYDDTSSVEDPTVNSDPLSSPSSSESMSPGARVTDFDPALLDAIDKDVRRTLPSLSFFHSQVLEAPHTGLPPRRLFLRCTSSYDQNFHAVERLLYIFAKLNPGIQYVQGMSFVVFPVFYLLANDNDLDGKLNAEADAFFLFHEILSEYRDLFIESMDTDATGINSALASLRDRVTYLDPDLAHDMETKGITPAFFAFRWLTCLCAQEFDLPDLLRFWDSVFADRQAARNRGANEAETARPDPVADALVAATSGNLARDLNEDIVHVDRRGLFVTDFLAGLLTARRVALLAMPFDEALQLLQRRHSDVFDAALRAAYRFAAVGDDVPVSPPPPHAHGVVAAYSGAAIEAAVAGWTAVWKRVGSVATSAAGSEVDGDEHGGEHDQVRESTVRAPPPLRGHTRSQSESPPVEAVPPTATSTARGHGRHSSLGSMGGMMWNRLKNVRSSITTIPASPTLDAVAGPAGAGGGVSLPAPEV
ncbi:hypothetical protein AMAG_00331 [Allomyces macrogynus ATCC 38327]|uniref:Rab-GAP TBC domain-containing protein n=1 Tax=Allomyces macrogynus (strain ATCC 38327) TaxID=578462 RepID=A0A0L0RV70_ALLM3|nr:hypothetical protein AMAG_00331 [Allomyces macrogynus ATCC 38327]|eukprot:KNE54352.1 hypothetical protein AMAG_00331 [Allomyces macrogynus ATCC 38327]